MCAFIQDSVSVYCGHGYEIVYCQITLCLLSCGTSWLLTAFSSAAFPDPSPLRRTNYLVGMDYRADRQGYLQKRR